MNIPYISILTPTFNRVKYLHSLINSLINQKFTNIEWIIGDDGSTDNTEDLIKKFIPKLKFSVIYIKSSKRIGKASMDNILINKAKGKYVVWCDSDDFFVDDILNDIFLHIKEIENNNNLSGLVFQNLNEQGVSQSFDKKNIPKLKEIVNYKELLNYLIGDATFFVKNKIIKKIYFKEVDFVISEGSEINKVFKNELFLLSNKIVKIMQRNSNDRVSSSKKLKFNRGMTYSLAEYINKENFYNSNFKKKLYDVSNLWRYSIHGDISISKLYKIWPLFQNKIHLIIYLLPGVILAIYDIIFKGIEKTHIEFEQNKKDYKISIVKYNEK
tara:strand:+ start:246 stop:1226 length:981 start_codon:yes stop_codon:yes gene_type:complete